MTRAALAVAAAVVLFAPASLLVRAQGKLGPEVRTPSRAGSPVARERVVAPRFGALVVLTGVSGASVRVEAIGRRARAIEARASDDGAASFERLAPGKYRIVANADEYRGATGEATVAVGKSARVDARLVSLYGTIVLAGSDLAAATRVLVDGREVPAAELSRDPEGRLRLRVEPGDRELTVEGPKRLPYCELVRAVAGVEAPVAVALPLVPGRLRVRTLAGASVYVDDAPAGRVPASGEVAIAVEPEVRHRLRVEADAFEPAVSEATVGAGAEVVVATELARRPTSGPFGDAFVDDSLDLWSAPSSWRVDAKRQTLVVEGEGVGLARSIHYEDFEMMFNLRVVDGPGAAWVVRATPDGGGYLFMLTGPAARRPSQLRVFALEGGHLDPKHVLFAPLPVIPDLVEGASYSVRVRVEGDTVRTWLRSGETGQEVSIGNFVDSERRFRAGGLGFAGVGGRFEINGVEARPLTTAAEAAKPR